MGGGTDRQTENAKVEASLNLRLAESGAKKRPTWNKRLRLVRIEGQNDERTERSTGETLSNLDTQKNQYEWEIPENGKKTKRTESDQDDQLDEDCGVHQKVGRS